MPFSVLDLGEVCVASETILRGAGTELIWVPVRAMLISAGGKTVLYDAGCGEGEAPSGLPTRRSLRQTLNVQLAKYGVTVKDIDAVVISHLHEDHFGGAFRFTEAPVYVPQEELSACGESAPQLRYVPLSQGEERELFPGLRILSLPGHTKNLLGLALEEAGKKYLFASDAVYTPIHLGPPVRYSGYPWDDETYRKTVERIAGMEENGWEIVWNHWPIPELKG